MTLNLMLDLETLGTRPGCSILSVGIQPFSEAGLHGDGFYRVINRRTCAEAGLHEDPETLAWWARQDHDAQRVLLDAGDPKRSHPLGAVLGEVWDYVIGSGQVVSVWGNGASFDQPILAEAYRHCGFGREPWNPFAVGCYRTLKNLFPTIKMVRSGTHHNALDDARSQASHAVILLNHLEELKGRPQ